MAQFAFPGDAQPGDVSVGKRFTAGQNYNSVGTRGEFPFKKSYGYCFVNASRVTDADWGFVHRIPKPAGFTSVITVAVLLSKMLARDLNNGFTTWGDQIASSTPNFIKMNTTGTSSAILPACSFVYTITGINVTSTDIEVVTKLSDSVAPQYAKITNKNLPGGRYILVYT